MNVQLQNFVFKKISVKNLKNLPKKLKNYKSDSEPFFKKEKCDANQKFSRNRLKIDPFYWSLYKTCL